MLYLFNMCRYFWSRRKETYVVFSRDIMAAWFISLLGRPVIYEAHGIPASKLLLWQFAQVIKSSALRRLIVISGGLRNDLAALDLLPSDDKVVILHDGAKPSVLDDEKNLAFDSKLNGGTQVGYVGNLYKGRGIEIIISVANRLPEISFHIIGGEEHDLKSWHDENLPDNLHFHGFVAPGDINAAYEQFDLLLLPYQKHVYGATGQSDLSRWMSPMKMFEYMLAGKPIVSSDFPVLREVLEDGRNALLVPADDVEAWEAAVLRIQSDPELAKRLGMNAKKDLIDNYTWTARAKKALQGI
jgi:glycosyltransferase involved in cell wall biosynthesis